MYKSSTFSGLSWAQHSPYSGISTTLAGNNVYALSPQSYQPSHFCEVLVESGTEMVTQAGLSHGIPAQAYISNAQNSRQQYFSGPQSRPFRYFLLENNCCLLYLSLYLDQTETILGIPVIENLLLWAALLLTGGIQETER